VTRAVSANRQPERFALLLVVLAHASVLGLWLSQRDPVTPDIKLMSVRMLSPAPVAPSVQPHAQKSPVRAVAPLKPQPPITRVQTPEAASAPVEPLKSAPTPPAPEPIKPVETATAAPAAPVEATLPPRFDAHYLDNPSPRYPPLSRKLSEQGRVLLRVTVTAGGRAQRVEIERSSGHARLDDSAIEAVTDWRFIPAKQGEHAVSALVLVPIVFSLTR